MALAIARGWAPDKATAESVAARLANEPATQQEVIGRLLPTEAPEAPDPKGDPTVMTTMSAAALYNLWTGVDGVDVWVAVKATEIDSQGRLNLSRQDAIEELSARGETVDEKIDMDAVATALASPPPPREPRDRNGGGFRGGRVRNVADHRDTADFGSDGLGKLGVEVAHGNPGAQAREPARSGGAQSRGTPGDDGGLILQLHGVLPGKSIF